MPSDLDQLIEMGFESERAQIAVKKAGGLQGALEWLEANQDKSLDDITASEQTQQQGGESEEPPALKPGEVAQSLVCNECGKKFRSQGQAEFHASKSGHVDFAESTEEIAPLTEAEKAEKLSALKQKAEAKRADAAQKEKAEHKRNEEIRRKANKESQDAKEELQRKQRIKEAEKKKREAEGDKIAKARVREKIEADKKARREKAEQEKARREGRAAQVAAETPAPAAPSAPKPSADYTESRLRLQTPDRQNIMKKLPVETTLLEIASSIELETGIEVNNFAQNFPRKVFTREDFGNNLKELNLVPSASLIIG